MRVDWAFIVECEHFQALRQKAIIKLSRTVVLTLIES
jgi:hypothetical protein